MLCRTLVLIILGLVGVKCNLYLERQYIDQIAKYLGSQIDGAVYPKGSYFYEMRRKIHHGSCLHRLPDMVVVPRSTLDVSKIVRVAREYDMEISVRSGGHSFICNNIKDSGIHIDMRDMNRVQLQKVGYDDWQVVLGPGSMWKRVLEFVPREHFTIIHGQCLSVGVGGYLLGGGVNVIGTTDRHGSGAQNVKKFTMVTAAGDVAEITEHNVTVWDHYTGKTSMVYDSFDMHKVIGNAGSSFGIVTEFVVRAWAKPETKPAIALMYLENASDLRKLEQATLDGRYNVVWFYPYIFRRNYFSFQTLPYILGIRHLPEMLGFLQRRPVDPIMVSLVDQSGVDATDKIEAFRFLKSYGLRLAKSDKLGELLLPDMFDLFDYEHVYMSNEEIKKEGYQAIDSANFMGIDDLHALDNFLFDHPVFGLRHKFGKASMRAGCDFCYLIVASSNRPKNVRQILDLTNPGYYQFELTCTYRPKMGKNCPRVLKHVKQQLVNRARKYGYDPVQYVNTPSCDFEGNFGQKYYPYDYDKLVEAKKYWDPDNVFNHCQSIGSTREQCCPQH